VIVAVEGSGEETVDVADLDLEVVIEVDSGVVIVGDLGEVIEVDLEEGTVEDGVDLGTEEEDEVVSVAEEGSEEKPLNAGVEASTAPPLHKTRKLLSTKSR